MSKISQVRLLTGDSLAEKIFTDDDITFFLSENKDCIYMASAVLLESWAAKYVATPESETIGDYTYRQSTIKNMLELANTFKEKAVSKTSSDFSWAVIGKDEL